MSAVSAVFLYEWRRTLTAGRIGWWFVLALFPVLIALLIRMQPQFARGMRPEAVDTVWSIVFYLLIPCVCCTLGAFLNAAPAIAGELEQRSWVYLATRPRGVLWLMLGKYFVAIAWASSSALLSILLASVVSQMDFATYRGWPETSPRRPVVLPSNGLESDDTNQEPSVSDAPAATMTTPDTSRQGDVLRLLSSGVAGVFQTSGETAIRRTAFTMAKLSLLSSCAYAALFLMIGALFPRRAMVFSVAYIALVEVVLSLIPAVINRITFQYRLRSLMVSWADPAGQELIQDNMFFKYVFAEGSNTEQIAWLCGLTLVFLMTALIVAQRREFTAAAESDV